MTWNWKAQLLIGSLLGGWAGVGGPLQALEIAVSEHQVEASGVTAGGEVAWLTVWRELDERSRTRVTLLDRTTSDEDGDGRVTLEVERPIPPLSVWVAVDVTTGQAAIVSPEGIPLRWAPDGSVRRTGPHIEVALKRPELLLVRPGLGAFRARVADGARDDAGARGDARVTLTPSAFRRAVPKSVPPGPPDEIPLPQRFASGDVLVGVDMRTLEVVLAEVE